MSKIFFMGMEYYLRLHPARAAICVRRRVRKKRFYAFGEDIFSKKKRASVWGQHVALAAHCLQITGLLWVCFNLAAQAGDLNVDSALLRLALIAA